MGLPIGHLSMSGVHSCASETHKYASILFQPVCDRWIDILRIFTCACRCRLEISKLLAEYRHSHEHNFNFQRYRYPSFVIVVSMAFIVHHTIHLSSTLQMMENDNFFYQYYVFVHSSFICFFLPFRGRFLVPLDCIIVK